MAVSYKKPLHLMIERDITNKKLMHDANISANIITKIKIGRKQQRQINQIENMYHLEI